MKILRDELDTMHTLEQAATAGPWKYETDEEDNCLLFGGRPMDEVATMSYVMSDGSQPDAAFIAAARSFVPRAVEALRFTEASTEEALLILDDALDACRNWNPEDQDLGTFIEMAVQKLRPEPAPVHDAAALERLLAHDAAEQAADGGGSAGATYFYQHTDGMRVGIRFSKLEKAVEFMMLIGPNWKLDVSSLPQYARPLARNATCVGGVCGSCPNDAPRLTQDPAVPYGQPNARGQNEAAADNGFAS